MELILLVIRDLLSIRSIENNDSQFSNAAIIPVFCICVLILVIHCWLQPYKRKGLNILDGCVLITLVFVMVNGTSPNENDHNTVALLLILPLLLLVNYLTLCNKLRHAFIPGSCIAIIAIQIFATCDWKFRCNPSTPFADIPVILFFIILASFITLIALYYHCNFEVHLYKISH